MDILFCCSIDIFKEADGDFFYEPTRFAAIDRLLRRSAIGAFIVRNYYHHFRSSQLFSSFFIV
jgi:hypothetical protein